MSNETLLSGFQYAYVNNPTKLAIITPDGGRTYEELSNEAQILSQECLCLERPVASNAVWAIYAESKRRLLTAIIACTREDRPFVILSRNAPKYYNDHILQDSQATLLICENTIQSLAPTQTQETSENDCLCLVYTSGTTGLPKGVMIREGAIKNRIRWMENNFPSKHDERYYLKSSITFVDILWDIFHPLTTGCALVASSIGDLVDHKRLLRDVEEYKVTRLSLVPSHLKSILASVPEATRYFSKLNILDITGEALSGDLAEYLLAMLPEHVSVINRYGLTEAPSAFYFDVRKYNRSQHGPLVPIGLPISGNSYDLRSMPTDKRDSSHNETEGELILSGRQLSAGYWRQQRLSGSRFLVDVNENGRNSFATGDVAKVLPDGNVTFVGRNDEDIKINGERVSLTAIEYEIRRLFGVKDCAVIPRNDSARPTIVAFVVVESALDADSIATALEGRLPKSHWPARIAITSKLMRTLSQKLDRKALLETLNNKESSEESSALECEVQQIAQDVLRGSNRPQLDQNLYELGLDSLSATELSFMIERRFNIYLNVTDVFASPTVRALSRLLEDKTSSKCVPRSRTIHKKNSNLGGIPVSGQQKLLLQLETNPTPTSGAYIDIWHFMSRSVLDAKALNFALAQIVHKHSIFRTVYESDEHGNFTQRVLPRAQHTFLCTSSELPKDDILTSHEADLRKLLEGAPLKDRLTALLHCKLTTCRDNTSIISFATHHITNDAFSGKILNRDLQKTYADAFLPRPITTRRPDEIDYLDYAWWQNENSEKQSYIEGIGRWKENLSDIKIGVDIRGSRRSELRPTAFQLFWKIPSGVLKEIDKRRKSGVTPFMIYLAAFSNSIYQISAAEKFVIGTPSLSRDNHDTRSVVGFFPNMLPLIFNGPKEIDDRIETTKSSLLSAMSDQHLMFVDIIQDKPRQENELHSFTNVCFSMPTEQERFGDNIMLGSDYLVRLQSPNQVVPKFDVACAVINPQDPVARFTVRDGCLSSDGTQRLISDFASALESITRTQSI